MKFKMLLLITLLGSSCISKFIPEISENKEVVVVEGLITDQYGSDTIKLYKSTPLGRKSMATPLRGCNLIIADDLGNSYNLYETVNGIYVTNADEFCGTIGRKYTLKIYTNSATAKNFSYESFPMEMKPVPPIDSLSYEKILISEADKYNNRKEGAQVYLDAHDPENNCKYYRWDYSETWEMRLPYDVPNKVCWISNNSGRIMIKNTSVLSENRITRFPINFISNESDRLNIKYSVLVNQYSLNDDEYVYWEKLQNINEEVGSLYDLTPESIPNNMYCIEDPNEKILGYFSVSAKSSKRLFIEDSFSGVANLYLSCEKEIRDGNSPIIGLGIYYWVIIDASLRRPPYIVLTDDKKCADCTTRGTNVKPSYWDANK